MDRDNFSTEMRVSCKQIISRPFLTLWRHSVVAKLQLVDNTDKTEDHVWRLIAKKISLIYKPISYTM